MKTIEMNPQIKYVVVQEKDDQVKFIGRSPDGKNFITFNNSSNALKAADYDTAMFIALTYDPQLSENIKIYSVVAHYSVEEKLL